MRICGYLKRSETRVELPIAGFTIEEPKSPPSPLFAKSGEGALARKLAVEKGADETLHDDAAQPNF